MARGCILPEHRKDSPLRMVAGGSLSYEFKILDARRGDGTGWRGAHFVRSSYTGDIVADLDGRVEGPLPEGFVGPFLIPANKLLRRLDNASRSTVLVEYNASDAGIWCEQLQRADVAAAAGTDDRIVPDLHELTDIPDCSAGFFGGRLSRCEASRQDKGPAQQENFPAGLGRSRDRG